MDPISATALPASIGGVSQALSQWLAAFLPSDVAALVGELWWLLAIVFLLSLPIGWKLGAQAR